MEARLRPRYLGYILESNHSYFLMEPTFFDSILIINNECKESV